MTSRRKFIAAFGTLAVGSLTGCSGDSEDTDTPTRRRDSTEGDSPTDTKKPTGTDTPTDTKKPTGTDTPTDTLTDTETSTDTETPTETEPSPKCEISAQSLLSFNDGLTFKLGEENVITATITNPYGFELTNGWVEVDPPTDDWRGGSLNDGDTFDSLASGDSQTVEWTFGPPCSATENPFTFKTHYKNCDGSESVEFFVEKAIELETPNYPDAWRQYNYNTANVSAHTDITGPTNSVIQQWTFNTGGGPSSPTVVDGTVYVGGYGRTYESGTYEIDAAEGPESEDSSPEHSGDSSAFVASSLAVVGGTEYVGRYGGVYYGGHDDAVYGYDPCGGAEGWSFNTDEKVTSSPAVVDGTVYIASDWDDYTNKNVFAINAADGTEQWSRLIGGDVASSPAVVDGTVYIGGHDRKVHAFNANDGTEQWAFDTDGAVRSSPAVADGTVYVGSDKRRLYAIDASDGSRQWAFDDAGGGSSPAVVDGTVYVGGGNDVYAIDAEDGTEQWTFQTGGSVSSSPAVADGTLYVGSDDHNVYAIDAEDGTEQWGFRTGGKVISSPAVAYNTVYVASEDDNVYALVEE